MIRIVLIAVSMLTLFPSMNSQKVYPGWKELKPGNHQVGFKTIDYWDHSRSIITQKVSQFLPIQISIWYPSNEAWNAQKALPFKHYFLKTLQKNDFEELKEEEKATAMEIFYNYAKFGAGIDLSQSEMESISSSPTAAMHNAVGAENRFPVVIAGHDGGSWKMSTLCEYLASHGYFVISTGPLSSYNQLYRNSPQQAINRRIRTIEIVKGMLSEFQMADPERIGLLGLNGDGIPTLLYQMKNQVADAMVSLDGWEGKNNGFEQLKNSVYYDVKNIDIPRLEFHQHEKPENEALHINTSLFDSLSQANRFYFILKDFGHAYLTGNLLILDQLDEPFNHQHYFLFETVKNFYEAYLKDDTEAGDALWTKRKGTKDFFHVDIRIRE
ncbi:alpha/beta hydrolase [Portibacter marinus]|uniref:hypothetical protein n=1 Tax=Portibacter marinus TaxID=2898660 RepID=UPI001F429DE0|nr:hypothetical protein [Portibacter marinus]